VSVGQRSGSRSVHILGRRFSPLGCTPYRVGHRRRVLRPGTSFGSNHGTVHPACQQTVLISSISVFHHCRWVTTLTTHRTTLHTHTPETIPTAQSSGRCTFFLSLPFSRVDNRSELRAPRLRILYMPPVYAVVSFFSYRYFRSYTYYSLAETGAFSPTLPTFLWTHPRVPCSVRGA
jgi:hypothetical protein